jgi:hypothetical protein
MNGAAVFAELFLAYTVSPTAKKAGNRGRKPDEPQLAKILLTFAFAQRYNLIPLFE